MAAKTATSPKRKSYANRVRALIISIFNLSKQDWIEQNKAWENWFTVEDRDRNQHEVEVLLKSDVKDAFKARVLAILLAPRAEDVPFVGGKCAKSDTDLMFDKNTQFSDLPPLLRACAFELLVIYTRAVEDRSRYGRHILDALTTLSPEHSAAAQLFDRYALMGQPDYPTFGELLRSKAPEKWKWLADAKMRELILTGKKTPTTDDGVLAEYSYSIMVCLNGKPFPYGEDLLVSQIEFLLGFPNLRSYCLCYDNLTRRGLERIGGVARRDLRHQFARRMVLDEGGESGTFEINYTEGRTVAVMLLKEFGESDPELGAYLRSAIADADKYKRKQNAAARKRNARDNALLARMR
jgi:hypothetical protein